jgi:hypothetical protein
MFSIVDRYKLWNCAAFGCDDDNGGGGSSSSSDKDDKPSGVGAGNKLSDGSTSLGSVSQTGQYAGDGFEWKQNPNTNALTRVYTGANANAGLGTDVVMGGTSNNNVKEVIANISLNEGSAFAASPGSATDGNLLNLVTDGTTGASDSYAAQVGATDFTPAVTYDSTQTGGANTALRDAQAAAEASSAALAQAQADLEAQQAALSLPVGGPGTFAPGALPAAPIQPVTPVSYGEAGRGGPDSAAPGNFTYQPGVDPELEMLVSLKNSGVDLDSDEYLKATAYENEKNASGSPTGGVQVADASGGILNTLYENIVGSGEVDTPGERLGQFINDLGSSAGEGGIEMLQNTAEGLGLYADEAVENIRGAFQPSGAYDPYNYFGYTVDPILDNMGYGAGQIDPGLAIAAAQNRDAQIAQQQAANQVTGISDFMRSNVVQPLAPVGDYFAGEMSPGMRDRVEKYATVDPNTTVKDILTGDVKSVSGETITRDIPALVVRGGEDLYDTVVDVLIGTKGLKGLATVAGLSAGEGAASSNQEVQARITEAIANGTADLQGLAEAKFGGNTELAEQAMRDAGTEVSLATAGPVAGLGDAALAAGLGYTGIPTIVGRAPGVIGLPVKVAGAGVSGGLTESGEQIGTNVAFNVATGQEGNVTQGAPAQFVQGLIGQGVSSTPSVLASQVGASQQLNNQDALANQAAMEQAAGTQGVASFAPGPANQTAVSTQPEAMTTAPTVFNPNLSETAGELAASNVPTAYDIEQDRVAGLLKAPQLDPMATSLDVMAAQEIIENQIRETGTISPEVMTNLQAATGLSMNDLSSMAVNASTGTLGGQTFPINVGSETPSDLMDQPTGIGGGSNISVEPLPSGETLLRNNDTGRTTVVDQGADLAAAIQTFDEVTTPFGAPEIDTAAPSLPPFNVAGAPGQPVLPAGTDTAPVVPSAPQAPTIPEIDVAGLGSLTPGSRPDIDTSSLPEGIATASTDTTVEVPATTDGDTLPAATGTEVIIDDDGSARQVGGLEGEVLGPEISTEVNPEQDTGVTIDMEAVTETDTTPEVETDTVVSLPPTDTTTDTTTNVVTDPNVLITTDQPPEEPEEPEEEPPVVTVDPPEEPPVVLIPPVTTTDDDGNTITECPEGYVEVQTPDGIMCEKITTTSTTTGRRTYGVGRTATTGLAGNIGRETPRSRTRTRTSTSTSRVKPTTRSA